MNHIGLRQFTTSFTQFALFDPRFVEQGQGHVTNTFVDTILTLPWVTTEIISKLQSELPDYVAAVKAAAADTNFSHDDLKRFTEATLTFWRE
jgi:hypothetical protein